MPSARVDIISIGTLSRNRIWGEQQAVRTAHATTTLVRTGGRTILVDPGLPVAVQGPRLFERTGLSPDKVDTIFLTNFRPSHRAGIELFARAKLIMGEVEQQWTRHRIEGLLEQAPADDLDRRALEADLRLLDRITVAPDKLAEDVDLFPLGGYTPGTCGLLVSAPITTLLIAGDAVPTLDHFLAGQALPDSVDIEASQESMREAYEIADLIVPGHDNLFLNPRASGM
jgi:Cft2 family RNA processing exonuclease